MMRFNIASFHTKIVALVSLLLFSTFAYSAAHTITNSNFTMLTGAAPGTLVGGANDVSGSFEDTLNCTAADGEACTKFSLSLASATTFFGFNWAAHDIRTFEAGAYTFDTNCDAAQIQAGTTSCGGGPALALTVGADQLGVHMLFDWGAPAATPCGVANCDIDVVVVWDYNGKFGANIQGGADIDYNWVSRDGDGDMVAGIPMVDGAFVGFSANFNLNMAPPHTPPVAADDTASTPLNTLVQIDLLANDSDAEDGGPPLVGGTVTLLTATSVAGATLVNNGDGTVDYDPTGTALIVGNMDTFQYTVADSGGIDSNPATVTVTIGANTAPVANNVQFTTDEDVPKTINITHLDDFGMAIGTDADMQPLTFGSVVSPTTRGGTVVIGGPNSITYTPLQDDFGNDTFNFTVNDGIENSAIATMTIVVNSINDDPVCTDVTVSTDVDTALDIDAATVLIPACTDVEMDTLTFANVTTQPVQIGSMVADNGGGMLTYTPAVGFEGDDSFTYTISDGTTGTAVATANVKVGTVFSNFTMLDSTGNVFGGTNDVIFTWDGTTTNVDESDTNFGVMEIASAKPQQFFQFLWTAHHIRVYGPGTYTFDTACTAAQYDAGTTSCGGSNPISMTVNAGQFGAHILFDWGAPGATPCGVANCDIDVVNVWDQNAAWDRHGDTGTKNQLFDGPAGVPPDPTTTWALVSTDANGDGINGSPMVDGPFKDFYANFNSTPATAGVARDPIVLTQGDTDLGDSILAAQNIYLLLISIASLFGVRRLTAK